MKSTSHSHLNRLIGATTPSRASSLSPNLRFKCSPSTSLVAFPTRSFHRAVVLPASPGRFRPEYLLRRSIMTSSSVSSIPSDTSKFKYPEARREEHYDTYKSAKQGKDVKVLDAYRWLEQPPNKSKETEAFVQAQAELTQKYLAQNPHREAFKEKLTENWNYARCEWIPNMITWAHIP